MDLDPLSLLANRNLAFVYQLSRRYRAYARQAGATLELAPNSDLAKFDLIWAQALRGLRSEAAAELGALDAESFPGLLFALLLAATGQQESALKQLEHVGTRQGDDKYVDAFWIAAIYASAGATNDALKWLQRAYNERSASMVQLATNPAFDPLRDEPHFQELRSRMDFPGL